MRLKNNAARLITITDIGAEERVDLLPAGDWVDVSDVKFNKGFVESLIDSGAIIFEELSADEDSAALREEADRLEVEYDDDTTDRALKGRIKKKAQA